MGHSVSEIQGRSPDPPSDSQFHSVPPLSNSRRRERMMEERELTRASYVASSRVVHVLNLVNEVLPRKGTVYRVPPRELKAPCLGQIIAPSAIPLRSERPCHVGLRLASSRRGARHAVQTRRSDPKGGEGLGQAKLALNVLADIGNSGGNVDPNSGGAAIPACEAEPV